MPPRARRTPGTPFPGVSGNGSVGGSASGEAAFAHPQPPPPPPAPAVALASGRPGGSSASQALLELQQAAQVAEARRALHHDGSESDSDGSYSYSSSGASEPDATLPGDGEMFEPDATDLSRGNWQGTTTVTVVDLGHDEVEDDGEAAEENEEAADGDEDDDDGSDFDAFPEDDPSFTPGSPQRIRRSSLPNSQIMSSGRGRKRGRQDQSMIRDMEFDFASLGLPGGRSTRQGRAEADAQLDELDLAFRRVETDAPVPAPPDGATSAAPWLPDAGAESTEEEEEEEDAAQIAALAHAVRRRGGRPGTRGSQSAAVPASTVRDWEEEQQQLFERELAASRRVRLTGRTRRGGGDGIKKQPVSREVGELLSKGNGQLISDDWDGARATFEEVIRIDPIQRDAWLSMAMIYEQVGDETRGLQARIVGAHLGRTSADTWAELAVLSEQRQLYQQAAHCYAKAAREDAGDVQWTIKRAALLAAAGDHRVAARLAGQALAQVPFDHTAGQVYINSLSGTGDRPQAVQYLEALARWNMKTFPYGEGERHRMGPDDHYPLTPTYGEAEMVTLADLYLQFGNGKAAIDAIRQGTRWASGRSDEVFWDAYESDDREYDEEQPRVSAPSPAFCRTYGHRREPSAARWTTSQLAALTSQAPPNPLQPVMRVFLARARLLLKNEAEAKHHLGTIMRPLVHYTQVYTAAKERFMAEAQRRGLEEVPDPPAEELPDFPVDVADLAHEVAKAYQDAGLWEDLLTLGHTLSLLPQTNTAETWWFIGKAELELGHHETAHDTLSQAVAVDPRMHSAKLDLARASEALGRNAQAMHLVQEVMAQYDAEAGTGLDLVGEGGLFDESANLRPAAFGSAPSQTEMRRMQARRERDTEHKFTILAQLQRVIYRVPDHPPVTDVDPALADARAPGTDSFWWRPDMELGSTPKEARALKQYLSLAESLVEQFTSNQTLFGVNKRLRFTGKHESSADLERQQSRVVGEQRTQRQEAGALMNRLETDLEAQRSHDPKDGGKSGHSEPKQTTTTYAGVALDSWVDMFMNYAFVLTKEGRGKAARDMLEAVIPSTAIYPFEDRILAMELAKIASALYERDTAAVFKGARYITGTYAFHEMPVTLWMALANWLGFYGRGDAFSNEHRRYFKRRNGTIDWIASGRPHTWHDRRAFIMMVPKSNTPAAAAMEVLPDPDDPEAVYEETVGDDTGAIDPLLFDAPHSAGADRTPELSIYRQRLARGRGRRGKLVSPEQALLPGYPVKGSPSGLAFEAASMLGTLQNQGAIGAAARALETVPSDPLLNMLAGVASLARTEQRQVDNRHQMVLQGLAFLSRSHKLSSTHGTAVEAYNLARAYQGLSLAHLAAEWYEKCLLLCQSSGAQGVSREAAFNLALLYTQAGNYARADALYDRWLLV